MLLTVFVVIILFSILILIHELGHFLAAKKVGIKVEEFGIGLPPRIWGIKRGETEYTVNWLPIGGFVRLYGEEGLEGDASKSSSHKTVDHKLSKRAFYNRPIWQRVVVITAGVAMNFLLGVTVISYLFTQGVMVPTDRVHIEKIIPGSPAEEAGLKERDVISSLVIKDQMIFVKSGDDVIKTTREHLGEEITLYITRENYSRMFEYKITPRKDYPKDQGPMGIVISNYEQKKYSLLEAPIKGTKETVVMSWMMVKEFGKIIWKLISFQEVPKDVAGPIGIAVKTGEVIRLGRLAVLEWLGLLSMNLAIINILPFPALDGGRLLFIVIEAVTGKRVKITWERYIHQIGMIMLLMLVVLISANDIVRYIGEHKEQLNNLIRIFLR